MGNGTINTSSTQEYGFKVKPQKIIWIYGEGNDLDNLRDELNIPIMKKYLEKNFSQELILKQKEIDQFLLGLLKKEYALSLKKKEFEKIKRRDYLLKNLIKLYMVRKNTINYFFNLDKYQNKINDAKEELQRIDKINGTEKNLKMFNIIGEKFKQLSNEQGSNCILFICLIISGIIRIIHTTEGEMFNREKILEIITKLNIPIIDLHEEVFKLERTHFLSFHIEKIDIIIMKDLINLARLLLIM